MESMESMDPLDAYMEQLVEFAVPQEEVRSGIYAEIKYLFRDS
jgi:hypothetical protein